MQDRIKAIITTSWRTAVEQTEKKIGEIFESNALTVIGIFLLSNEFSRNHWDW